MSIYVYFAYFADHSSMHSDKSFPALPCLFDSIYTKNMVIQLFLGCQTIGVSKGVSKS